MVKFVFPTVEIFVDGPDIYTINGKHKEELRTKYGVKSIGIFGSYVRGEQKKRSDVDILVEFEESSDLSLLDFIGLELSWVNFRSQSGFG